MTPLAVHSGDDMLLAITGGADADVPGGRSAADVERQGQQDYLDSVRGRRRGRGQLQWLLILPPGSSITIYVGKRKLIMRDEDLQKVRAERGRRGSVSRGLQRIDSVEVNAPARQK